MPNGKKVPSTWEEYLKQPEYWPRAAEHAPPASSPAPTPTPAPSPWYGYETPPPPERGASIPGWWEGNIPPFVYKAWEGIESWLKRPLDVTMGGRPLPLKWREYGYGGYYRPDWPSTPHRWGMESYPYLAPYPESWLGGPMLKAWSEKTGIPPGGRPLTWEDITPELLERNPELAQLIRDTREIPEGTMLMPPSETELGEWYRGLPGPPSEDLLKAEEEYGQRYANEPFRNLPEGWEQYPEEDKINWLNYSSYGAMIVDRFGKQLSRAEMRDLARTDPDADVFIIYSRGGGNVAEMVIPASDALRVNVPEDLLETHPELFTPAGQKPWDKWDTFEAVKTGVLANKNLTYEQKESELYDTLAKLGLGTNPRVESQIKHDVWESLSPEEQKQREIEGMKGIGEAESKRMWQEWMRRYGQKVDFAVWLEADMGKGLLPEPKAEAIDIDKLGESLKSYGANIIENYPFISPMPEQTLMSLPPETLDLMARYLSGKGLSWREFLTISSSLYGGGGGARGRYAIPAQWS